MSGSWETNRPPAVWRRVLAPAVFVVTGLVAGLVALPSTSQPGLPLDVEPPASEPQPRPEPEPEAGGRWAPMAAGPLSSRQQVTSVWTGTELLVWGGRAAARGPWFADGAAYDPRTDRWRSLSRAPLHPRAGASGVWTGTEFIVWGGAGAARGSRGPRGIVGAGVETAHTTQVYDDGAAYDPRTDRWRRLAAAPLSPRRDALMVWTGRDVVVLGGMRVTHRRHEPDGARYDPDADTWAPIAPGPLGRRENWLVQAVALDGRTVVWSSDLETVRTAVYDPQTDAWSRIPPPRLQAGVVPSLATIAGGVMLWGGWSFPRGDPRPMAARYTTATGRWITVTQPPSTPEPGQPLVAADATALAWRPGGGLAYDGVRDRWDPIPQGPNLPADALQAWAGDRLLLWNPVRAPDGENRGAAWIPGNPWRALPRPPSAFDTGGTAVWSGWLQGDQQVLAWGGLDHGSHDVGGAFDPALRLWEALPRAPLSRRVDPAAAWLAPEMVIVGGRDLPGAPALRDAAAYNARTRSWRRMPDAPMGAAGSALAVAGDRLYAAGDGGGLSVAEYDRRADAWTELPPAPIRAQVDRFHVAWTEFELWVWGTRADGEGAGAAWSPRRRRWRKLPRLQGVTGHVASSWATSRLFLLAEDGATVSLGRGAVDWWRHPRSPVRGAAATIVWNGNVLLALDPASLTMAGLDPRSSGWADFPAPVLPPDDDGRLLWTGRNVYAFVGDAAAELAR